MLQSLEIKCKKIQKTETFLRKEMYCLIGFKHLWHSKAWFNNSVALLTAAKYSHCAWESSIAKMKNSAPPWISTKTSCVLSAFSVFVCLLLLFSWLVLILCVFVYLFGFALLCFGSGENSKSLILIWYWMWAYRII